MSGVLIKRIRGCSVFTAPQLQCDVVVLVNMSFIAACISFISCVFEFWNIFDVMIEMLHNWNVTTIGTMPALPTLYARKSLIIKGSSNFEN